MLLKICYDFVITDEINISSFRHKLVLDQMTTKKVVKVVSFGLSPIGEKYPQTKEKPYFVSSNSISSFVRACSSFLNRYWQL